MATFDNYDEEEQHSGGEVDTGRLLDDAKDLYDRFNSRTSPEDPKAPGANSQNLQNAQETSAPQAEQSDILSGNSNIPEVDYSAMRDAGAKGKEASQAVENTAQAQETTAEASELGGMATETAEGMAEGAAKDVAAEAVKKGAEAGAEKGAEAAAGAAAGAAEAGAAAGAEAAASSTGAGAVIVAAYEGTKAAAKEAVSWGKVVTGETRKTGFGWIFWIAIFLLIFNGTMTHLYKTTFGSIDENYIEGQYSEKHNIKDVHWGFNWFFSLFDGGEEDEVGEFDSEFEFTEGCDRAIKYINRGFERALDIAKNHELPWIIEKEGYDYELTMESYESEEEHFYDDINYAEVIEVVQQKEELNSENLIYKKFKKLFNPTWAPWKLQLLYRMKVEPDYAEKTIEVTDIEGNVIDTRTETVLYGKVTLKHYDLESLYRFVEVDALDYNAQIDNMYNINFLDESEENLRVYADYYDFGPYTRTPWSYGFEESGYVYSGGLLAEFEKIIIGDIDPDEELKVGDLLFYAGSPNGRYKNVAHVAFYAGNDMIIDASSGKGVVVYRSVYKGRNYNQIISVCRPIADDDDGMRQQALEFAMSQLGKEYSMAHRLDDGYYDCSSFIDAVYRSVGIEFGGYAPVAADICKTCEGRGQLVALSYPRKK